MKKRLLLTGANGHVGRAPGEKVDACYDRQLAILHAVSDNRFKRMDITSTRKVVDYQPQDDGLKFSKMASVIENAGMESMRDIYKSPLSPYNTTAAYIK